MGHMEELDNLNKLDPCSNCHHYILKHVHRHHNIYKLDLMGHKYRNKISFLQEQDHPLGNKRLGL